MNTQAASVEMIKVIALALGELNQHAVFVGGATLPFYVPEAYHALARPTEDIDVVMEIVGHSNNWTNEETLRAKGFSHDTRKGAPKCRWLYRDFSVDIMSSDSSAFGFTNVWYKEGVKTAIEIIRTPVSVKIFSLPYFLGAKLEAFKSRGNSDFLGSEDMEDIISVLEVSTFEMLEGILPSASAEIQTYIKKEFENLLKIPDFMDAVHGSVFNRSDTHASVLIVKKRMEKIIKLS